MGDFIFNWFQTGEKEQTVAKLLWDDENLYVSWRCRDRHISAYETKRHGPVSKDDCVEIFLSPKNDGSYFHLMVNPEGYAAYEEKRGDIKEFTRAEHRKMKNGWEVTVKVPFRFLGKTPQSNETWGFNIFRDKKTAPREVSMWNETYGTFHNTDAFGAIRFL